MTKIKILANDELFRLEEAVNSFISDKKVVDIKFCVANGEICNFKYALIIYEED